MHGNIISPRDRDSFEAGNADHCVDSDKEEDEDSSPTPAYKLIQATQEPKSWDPKVTLGSNHFTFLHPLTFDTKQFSRDHPQVNSEDDIERFNSDFQKQFSFNFCATRALLGRSHRLSTKPKLGLVVSMM